MQGFTLEEAAKEADENWAKLFQQRDTAAVAEEESVDLKQVAVADAAQLERALQDPSIEVRVNVAKLLVALGMKASRTEAEKQVAAGVNIDGTTTTQKFLDVPKRPARIPVRVGKHAKIAVIARQEQNYFLHSEGWDLQFAPSQTRTTCWIVGLSTRIISSRKSLRSSSKDGV